MRILGLDPGSRHTGFGVVEQRGQKLTALTHGRISIPTDLDMALRLDRLVVELESLLECWRPNAVVLEALFHGVNSRSLIVLAQARGALLAQLGRRGLEVAEYSPAEVKRGLCGHGRADKSQVARMVQMLLGLPTAARSSDATDALALAIYYSQRARMDRLEGRLRHSANL